FPTAAPTLPDLVLNVSASPDPVAAGQILSYFISVRNNGGLISGQTSVTGQIPVGTSVNSLGAGCSEDAVSGTFRCRLVPLGSNQQQSFEVNLNVTAPSGSLFNRFAVDAENAVAESDESNNILDRTVLVTPTSSAPTLTPVPTPTAVS